MQRLISKSPRKIWKYLKTSNISRATARVESSRYTVEKCKDNGNKRALKEKSFRAFVLCGRECYNTIITVFTDGGIVVDKENRQMKMVIRSYH